MKPWKTLSTKMAFDHRWFKVRQDEVQLPNGKILDDYFVWVKDDVSMVVPFTEDGKFVMVRQYKHGAGMVVTEFPAGFIHKGEDPLLGAERELVEETGYVSQEIVPLITVTNDATKETSKVFIYLAKNAELKAGTSFDDTEDIELLLLSPTEVFQKILEGEILVSASVLAAFLAFEKLRLLNFSR